MLMSPADRYLDLLKKTLSFALWREPPIPVEQFNYQRGRLMRLGVDLVTSLLRSMNLQLVRPAPFTVAERLEGKTWPGLADTMVGMKRLDNLHACLRSVLADGVPGDFIETGVWRGGSCIFARGFLAAHGVTDRRVFVADSFAGLPPPDVDQGPADRGDVHHTHAPILAVSQQEVEANFRRYGLLDEQVVFLKGWFKDTLPSAPIEQLAILRLDGDMYGSTMDALNALYRKLSPGGFCIVDDHALPGCRQAIDDYRREHGIVEPIEVIDWTGVFWRKARA
jgi:hypothetical protein